MNKILKILVLIAIVLFFNVLLSISELLFNVVFNLVLLFLLIHMSILQGREIMRIKDRLFKQRVAWFLVFFLSALSLCPIVVSQYLKLIGEPSDYLIYVATILSPLQRGTIIGLAYYVYISRIKEL